MDIHSKTAEVPDKPLNQSEVHKIRRLILDRQGLLRRQPFSVGTSGLLTTIQRLGYIQIDTISVVARAHHHTWASRVPNYTPAQCDSLLAQGQTFEYWSHAAAFLPMQDFRYSLREKAAVAAGISRFKRQRDKPLMNRLLQQIRADGPLSAKDLEDTREQKSASGWWNWKPAKKALEMLWLQGDVMVSERRGFQKHYDLTERILPGHVGTTMPSLTEQANFMLDQALLNQVIVTPKSIAYERHDAALTQAVADAIESRVADGSLLTVRWPKPQQTAAHPKAPGNALEKAPQKALSGARSANKPAANRTEELWFTQPETLQSAMPKTNPRLRILSPFDNVLIQRRRLLTLFDFDYQIECYVPERKRRFGYFALPLLWRDQFIGRLDCKAHRHRRVLELKLTTFEIDASQLADAAHALAQALPEFCVFQGCDQAQIGEVRPPRAKGPLQRAVRTVGLT